MHSEKQIEDKLKKHVKEELNGLCIKMSPQFLKGIPDRVCLLPGGRAIFVELKAPGKKPKKLQAWWHRKLQALGFATLVIDSYEQIEKIT